MAKGHGRIHQGLQDKLLKVILIWVFLCRNKGLKLKETVFSKKLYFQKKVIRRPYHWAPSKIVFGTIFQCEKLLFPFKKGQNYFFLLEKSKLLFSFKNQKITFFLSI